MKLLGERLRPAVVDPKAVDRLIADLGSEEFTTREKASAGLEALGDVAEPALLDAVKSSSTPEVRKRAGEVLRKLSELPTTGQLRELRAVEVLEYGATPSARRLLENLAEGAPGARLTKDAQAALTRLRRVEGGP